MSSKRLNEVIQMFSYISGKNYDESKRTILLTETGKAIQEQSSVIMYEQQTESLYSIIKELRENDFGEVVTDLFTVEAITAALIKVNSDSKQEVVPRAVIQKKLNKRKRIMSC